MEKLQTPLSEALDEYVSTYLPARNMAVRSRREYTTDLTELIAFLQERGVTKTHQIALPSLNAFLAYLDPTFRSLHLHFSQNRL